MSVNVRAFIPGGATDCSAGIQEAIDSLTDPSPGWPDESGGELFFPAGQYRVSTIRFPIGNLTLRGEGGPGGEFQATHLIHIGEGPMFVFPYDAGRINDICFRDMNLIGNRSGKDVAFELWSGSKFRRSFTWDRVGAMRFGRVIETCREGSLRWVGNLQIKGCNWSLNGQAIHAVETRINGLSIIGSNIRKNSPPVDRGVIHLDHANSVAIERNCLEGQRDTLFFDHGDSLIFSGNYLEGQAGWVSLATGSHRILIGPNHYRILGSDEGGVGKFRFDRCDYINWPGWDRERYDFGDSTNVTPNPTVR
ncbi:hypothetical protein LCGC14_0643530 [marine sediment metagenome]|uniref:Pectate lyase superfamily protein domain-containing protein n=1 Tax=marine sediment metagenome TaxID=412755 RepID=A0A0F9RI17_9ZZZZ